MNQANIPRQNSDLAGGSPPSREWYNFFRRVADYVNGSNTQQSQSGGLDIQGGAIQTASWGGIVGTLASQTDLQAALDAKGYLNLPKTTTGLEDGKCYSTSAGFTVNTRDEGDICSVYNNSGSSITLTQGTGLTLRVAGTATTGNYTLPQRGFVTIWWHTASEAIIL